MSAGDDARALHLLLCDKYFSIRRIERLPDAVVACGQGHAGVGLGEDHRRRQQSSSETNPAKTPDKGG